MTHRIPIEELKALCKRVNGESALYISVPQENQQFTWNAENIFQSASTIKIPILSALLQDGENGRADLFQKVIVKPENRVGGSGILQSLRSDLEMTLFDLAELMIVMSDNIATNEIIDAVGMDRVCQFCTENGFLKTRLGRKMQIKKQLLQNDPLEKKASEDPNITCAWDLGRMLEAIAAGTLVSEQASKKIVQIMAGQRLGRLKNLLPCTKRLNPYAEKLDLPPTGSVVAACKGGTLNKPGIAHDAGIFYLPDGRYYVMVMCTQSSNIKGAIEIIEKAGLLMYEAMK